MILPETILSYCTRRHLAEELKVVPMVPFHCLPVDQKAKDFIFKAVVDSLRGMLK